MRASENEPVTTTTLVLQSHRPDRANGWIQTCIETVSGWARDNQVDYRFQGDEIFELLPADFRHRFASRGAVLSDLARLLAMQQALRSGYDSVVWADADLLIFDPERLGDPRRLVPHERSRQQYPAATKPDCAFGLETWVDLDQRQRLKAWRNVHNALMAFHRDSVVLPYLIFSIESMARRIDTTRMAPQTFGPKLLSALHSISNFALIDCVGALSPPVCADIAAGGGRYLAKLTDAQPTTLAAANLCASLATDPNMMQSICNSLLREKSLPATGCD